MLALFGRRGEPRGKDIDTFLKNRKSRDDICSDDSDEQNAANLIYSLRSDDKDDKY